MQLTTLRNLMLSMLVLGAAASVVGVGTFAQFNATVTSTGNTFSTATITFSFTGSGNTCTASAGGTQSCSPGATTTIGSLSTMVPGDSKTMTTTLTNGGNVPVKVDLTITDAAGTHDNLVTTGIGAVNNSTGGTYGLGLVILECRDSSHNDVACGSATELYTVYGQCGTSVTSTSAYYVITGFGTGFSATNVNTTSVTNNSINVAGKVCYGGDTGGANSGVVGSGTGITVPIVATSGNPTVGNGLNSLPATSNNTDNLALIMYLPYTADSTLQGKTNPNLTFTWVATQLAGASS